MTQRRKQIETWVGRVMNVAVVLLTTYYVAEAIDHPSIYRVSVAVVAVALTASIFWSVYRALTGRQRPTITYARKNPATVPFDDVVSALETTTGRIEAIRDLRERHPGLTLKDAVDLVDEVTSRPDL